MKSLKREAQKFQNLPPELMGKIRPIKNHSEMVGMNEQIAELESQLGKLNHEFQYVSAPPESPRPRHCVDADAAQILSGVPVEQLDGGTIDSRRATLKRQLDATRAAIEIKKDQRRNLDGQLIKTACHELWPEAESIMAATLDAMERLTECLKTSAKFYQTLSTHGVKEGFRPSGWTITAFEQRLLFGDNNYPSLQFFIDGRKKVWHLDK